MINVNQNVNYINNIIFKVKNVKINVKKDKYIIKEILHVSKNVNMVNYLIKKQKNVKV